MNRSQYLSGDKISYRKSFDKMKILVAPYWNARWRRREIFEAVSQKFEFGLCRFILGPRAFRFFVR